jgi:hypothetical protein
MLERHPDLLVHPAEPQYILGAYQRFGRTIGDVHAALTYMTSHPYFPGDVSTDAEQVECTDARSTSLRELVHYCLGRWGSNALHDRRLVLKDPAFTFRIDLVHELFPNAYILHIVRDPRANVSSQRSRWPRASIWECASWWRNAVRAARAWRRQGHTPYAEVKYEELVLTPDETLKRLCRELELRYYPGMMEFGLETKSFAPGERPQPMHFTSLDRSRMSLWQERLAPIDIRLVELRCREEMAWWGYQPVAPRVSAARYASRLLGERLRYAVIAAIRRIRATMRQTGWRLGIARLTSRVAVTGGVSLEGEEHG